MNTLRVNGEIFEYGKKKLQIKKYLDTCERGLRIIIFLNLAWVILLFIPHKMSTRVSYLAGSSSCILIRPI